MASDFTDGKQPADAVPDVHRPLTSPNTRGGGWGRGIHVEDGGGAVERRGGGFVVTTDSNDEDSRDKVCSQMPRGPEWTPSGKHCALHQAPNSMRLRT